jgi:hypothetical protein
MIIAAVDDRDAKWRAGKGLGRLEPSEPGADDDDARKPGLHIGDRHLALHHLVDLTISQPNPRGKYSYDMRSMRGGYWMLNPSSAGERNEIGGPTGLFMSRTVVRHQSAGGAPDDA